MVRAAALAPGLAVATIWLATVVAALFAPDLVTGSAQEHLPLVGITCWLWAAVGTGYVLMAARSRGAADEPAQWVGFVVSVGVIWLAVTVASVFAPELVTGTDPTRIPLVALVAPVAGAVATGFVCLHQALLGRPRGQPVRRR